MTAIWLNHSVHHRGGAGEAPLGKRKPRGCLLCAAVHGCVWALCRGGLCPVNAVPSCLLVGYLPWGMAVWPSAVSVSNRLHGGTRAPPGGKWVNRNLCFVCVCVCAQCCTLPKPTLPNPGLLPLGVRCIQLTQTAVCGVSGSPAKGQQRTPGLHPPFLQSMVPSALNHLPDTLLWMSLSILHHPGVQLF